jgi:hypothetical protein
MFNLVMNLQTFPKSLPIPHKGSSFSPSSATLVIV